MMLNDISYFHNLPLWGKSLRETGWKHWKHWLSSHQMYWPDVKCFVCTWLQFIVSQFLLHKHLVQLFHLVFSQSNMELMLTFLVSPFPQAPHSSQRCNRGGPSIHNRESWWWWWCIRLGEYCWIWIWRLEWTPECWVWGQHQTNWYKSKWHGASDFQTKDRRLYIHDLRFLCWSQVPNQIPRYLIFDYIGEDGAGFISFVENCLSCERQHNSSWAANNMGKILQ